MHEAFTVRSAPIPPAPVPVHCAVPPPPVHDAVYVVDDDGATDTLPEVEPPLVKLSPVQDVAFDEVQLNVDDCPLYIDVGETETAHVGAGGTSTFNVKLQFVELLEPAAVPLYAVDERGPTVAEPDVFAVTYPTFAMYMVVAFAEVQCKVVDPPYAIGFTSAVTEHVGASVQVIATRPAPPLPEAPGSLVDVRAPVPPVPTTTVMDPVSAPAAYVRVEYPPAPPPEPQFIAPPPPPGALPVPPGLENEVDPAPPAPPADADPPDAPAPQLEKLVPFPPLVFVVPPLAVPPAPPLNPFPTPPPFPTTVPLNDDAPPDVP